MMSPEDYYAMDAETGSIEHAEGQAMSREQLEERLAFLEEEKRFTLDLLDTAAWLGNFHTATSGLMEPDVVLEEISARVRRFLPITQDAFYLVDETTSDFVFTSCYPTQGRENIEPRAEEFIDNGIFSWAIRENRPVFVDGAGNQRLMLHVLATNARVRGMYIARVETGTGDVYDLSLALLSNLFLHGANALESYELYRWVRTVNADLEAKVRELATSEQELKKHRFHLEELIDERTRRLDETVQELKNTVDEREMLLREVHHRVKNNLQVISSLLSLQVRSIHSPETAGALLESRNRIRSMALIHEHLYGGDSLSHIDVRHYVARLVGELRHALTSAAAIEFHEDVDPLGLDVDRAVSLGLVLTELISNCIKHAFAGREGGMVSISLKTVGADYELQVADDGVGLPPGVEERESETLGFQLVRVLAEQLYGRLYVASDEDGTAISLSFPQAVPEESQPM